MFTKKCTNQHVQGLRVNSLATGRRHLLRDVSFNECVFDSVLLADADKHLWKDRHEFLDVRASECCFRNCLIKGALLERVALVRCTAPDGGLVLWKCVLDEVVFDGSFDSLRVIPPESHRYADRSDYVIDVRGARCSEVEILGIPPHLVRYDANVGGVLSRPVLEAAGWPKDEVSEYFGGIMVKFKSYGGEASVYVVPTEAPEAPDLLEELAGLKTRGWIQDGGSTAYR